MTPKNSILAAALALAVGTGAILLLSGSKAAIGQMSSSVVTGVVKPDLNPGDTITVQFAGTLTGAADSVRLIVSDSGTSQFIKPDTTMWRSPVPSKLLLSKVLVPVVPYNAGTRYVIRFRAWAYSNNTQGTMAVSFAAFTPTKPTPPPGVITIDSSKVIGLIAVPESASYVNMSKRNRTMTQTTCYTEPAHTAYACTQDVNFMGCTYYRNGGNWSNSAPPIAHAKPVYWTDQFGNTYQMGGVAYNLNGTLHTQCATEVLPILCIVGDMEDGRKLLSKETWNNPECRKQLFSTPLPNRATPTESPFWLYADTTANFTTPIGKFEQVVAEYANHPNAPWGYGSPGEPGYAALTSKTPYPIGILQPDTIDAPLGAKVELAIFVRYSDNTVHKMVTPDQLFQTTEPGLAAVTGWTQFGPSKQVIRVAAPWQTARRKL